MKNISLLLILIFIYASSIAAIHVNIFTTPMVLIYTNRSIPDAGSTWSFYIQDSTQYYGFTIATNLSGHNLCFVEPFNNAYSDYKTEVDSVGNVAWLNCGDLITSDTLRWQALATLALDTGSANFDARGPGYLGFKRKYPGGFEYGWFKVSCSATGDTLIVYGYAYNDVVSEMPNIVAGQGECIDGITTLPLTDVSVICHSDKIKLSAPLPLQANLINMQGQVLKKWSFQGGTADYDCSELPHGVYLVEVQHEMERKIVKVIL